MTTEPRRFFYPYPTLQRFEFPGHTYEEIEKVGEGGIATAYKARLIEGRPTDVFPKIACVRRMNPLDGVSSVLLRIDSYCERLREVENVRVPTHVNHNSRLLVAPFITGRSLRSLRTHLPLFRSFRYARKLAYTLQEVHNTGLIHGDVKPDNALVEDPVVPHFNGTELDQRVVVIDLDSLGEIGQIEYEVYTTISARAPEAIEGAPSDPRFDVYSLGCLVYHMITGLEAFPTGTLSSGGIRRLIKRKKKPEKKVKEIQFCDSEVTALTHKTLLALLHPNPPCRIQTAQSAGDALGELVYQAHRAGL